jgi:signal transduction histidine kinase
VNLFETAFIPECGTLSSSSAVTLRLNIEGQLDPKKNATDFNVPATCYPRLINTLRAIPTWACRFWIMFFILFASLAYAQAPHGNASEDPDSTTKIITDLHNVLAQEHSTLEEGERNLAWWQDLYQRISEEIASYRIQDVAHANLLLVSQAQAEDLKTALNTNRLIAESLQERIKELEKIATIAADRIEQIADRIAIAEEQKKELQREMLPDSQKPALLENVTRRLTYNSLNGDC